jgi:hypothetical protein
MHVPQARSCLRAGSTRTRPDRRHTRTGARTHTPAPPRPPAPRPSRPQPRTTTAGPPACPC